MFQIGIRSLSLAALLAGLSTPEALAQAGGMPGDEVRSDTVTGELTVMHIDDFDNGRCETFYQLRDEKSGKTFDVKFNGRPPGHLKTGMKIRARGRVQVDSRRHGRVPGEDGRVADGELVLAEGNESIQAVSEPPVAQLVSGEKRAIVMVINLLDAPNTCTPSTVHSLMFGSSNSVKGLYNEMSYGALNITGDVVGPLTINYYKGSCDYNAWAAAADAAAQAAGVNLSQYTNKVYVLPNGAGCSWGGLGTVGGTVGRTWIATCGRAEVYAHELGHNFTMMHSSTDPEDDGYGNCEYCDVSDIMGYAGYGLRTINAPHKDQMGWIPSSKVLTPTASGTYQIAPLTANPATTPYPMAIKIGKPGTSSSYYFSYRRRLGYDANLGSGYAEAVNVHRHDGGIVHTYHLKTLSDGATFTDPTGKVSVKQVSRSADSVTVQVTLAGSPPPPAQAAPLVSLSPASQSGAAGAALSYSVTVKNQDGAGASPSTFSLTPGYPSGWTGSVSPASLTLQPGQTGSATLTVTSPAGASGGNYTVGVTARDPSVGVHTGSASAVYTIQEAPKTPAAPSVSLTPSAQTGRSGATLAYTFTVTNRDSANSPAATFTLNPIYPTGWSAAMSPASLTLQPGQTGTATLSVTSPAGASAGMFSVGARANHPSGSAYNATAGAVYAVEAPAVAAPSVSLTPSSQSGLAGATLGYSVTVTNRDEAGNPAATFALTSSLPSGWTGSLSPSSLTLQPGQSGTATLSVTSSGSAAAASYAVSVTARDSAVSVHTASASAAYTVQPPPPAAAAPTVAISPSTQSAYAGSSLTYSVTVTNRDAAGKPAATFGLKASVPSGWIGSISPAALTLQPGQSGTATLSVTSSGSAGAGSYPVGVTATDPEVLVHTASASATYEVKTAPPAGGLTAPIDLRADAKKNNIHFSWGASRGGVGTVTYELWRGSTLLARTTKTDSKDNQPPMGQSSYYVVARDAAGNVSPPSNTVTVEISDRKR